MSTIKYNIDSSVFLTLVTIILVIAKVIGLISISWILVFFPIWIIPALVIFIVAIVLLFTLIVIMLISITAILFGLFFILSLPFIFIFNLIKKD